MKGDRSPTPSSEPFLPEVLERAEGVPVKLRLEPGQYRAAQGSVCRQLHRSSANGGRRLWVVILGRAMSEGRLSLWTEPSAVHTGRAGA